MEGTEPCVWCEPGHEAQEGVLHKGGPQVDENNDLQPSPDHNYYYRYFNRLGRLAVHQGRSG